MTPQRTTRMPVYGWRARVWAWVLFLALFKGLVPHAALAAALMPGGPALLWCAPDKPRIEDRSASAETPASAQHCVCASFGEMASGQGETGAAPALPQHERAPAAAVASAAVASVWLPPARGPPHA